MTTYEEISKGFEIFAQYEGSQDISADADVIFAGPRPTSVSAEHKAFLKTIGWNVDKFDVGFWKYL